MRPFLRARRVASGSWQTCALPMVSRDPAHASEEAVACNPTSETTQLAFTSSQAASYLGVSLATVRRWTNAGHVQCYRTPGGQRRFSREQLDRFVASIGERERVD